MVGTRFWKAILGGDIIKGEVTSYDKDSNLWMVEYSDNTTNTLDYKGLQVEIDQLDPREGQRDKSNIPPFPSIETILTRCPSSFIGRQFWKTFDGYEPSHGTITEYHREDKLWSATYPDGDEEDFDTLDMVENFGETHAPPRTRPAGQPYSMDQTKRYPCKEGENFLNVCDSIGIPLHHRKIYYKWLGDAYGQFGEPWDSRNPKRLGITFNYPWGRGRKTLFRAGTRFPYPSGESWKQAIEEDKQRDLSSNQHHQTVRNVRLAEKKIIMSEWLRETFRKETPTKDMKTISDITNKETGKIEDPRNIREAMCRPDKELWAEAIRKELNALDELGVLSHGHRLEDIRKMGIASSPVPMQLLYDVKYHPDGALDKYKVRNVVQGHKGYMRKGEHFYNTFSASPSCRTTRLLQALTIGINLKRYAWDICTAYLWADVKENERMPIRYPRDLRRTDPTSGEELFAILKKNCYGMPQADRRYTQLRNAFILKKFNQGGWSCFKS
jgi:hypothetical protein